MSPDRAADAEIERVIAMVTEVSASGYRGELRAGRHHMVVDEGPEVGGKDEGPNPYQLLLAALTHCTSATLRMYADRKGWELGEIRVRARLLRTGEDGAKAERIERTIRVEGTLSLEQKQRLVEIADRTPVTRTLLNAVVIETTLQ